MSKRTISRMFLGAIALTLFACAGAHGQKKDCAKMTDEQIVDAIYAKLKTSYANHVNHVNVVSKDHVITLQGWAANKSIRKDIEKIARKVDCVKKVDNKLTIGVGGGCGQGEKACGGICIPISDSCNITRGN